MEGRIMADKELSPAIQRLSDKVAADPQSRVFVQLADEYLKCGLIEEAIGVLAAGIHHHPTHVAARMMLGKIYLKTKQMEQAEDEFEAVVQIYPDSILSHKNLAHIYRELGQLEKAMATCNNILVIDPKDQEVKSLLASIQREISVMGDIHSLSAPSSQAVMSPELSYSFIGEPWGGADVQPLFTKKNTPVPQTAEVGDDHHPAAASNDPRHIIRLQGWLASMQEKRKDGFQRES